MTKLYRIAASCKTLEQVDACHQWLTRAMRFAKDTACFEIALEVLSEKREEFQYGT